MILQELLQLGILIQRFLSLFQVSGLDNICFQEFPVLRMIVEMNVEIWKTDLENEQFSQIDILCFFRQYRNIASRQNFVSGWRPKVALDQVETVDKTSSFTWIALHTCMDDSPYLF